MNSLKYLATFIFAFAVVGEKGTGSEGSENDQTKIKYYKINLSEKKAFYVEINAYKRSTGEQCKVDLIADALNMRTSFSPRSRERELGYHWIHLGPHWIYAHLIPGGCEASKVLVNPASCVPTKVETSDGFLVLYKPPPGFKSLSELTNAEIEDMWQPGRFSQQLFAALKAWKLATLKDWKQEIWSDAQEKLQQYLPSHCKKELDGIPGCPTFEQIPSPAQP